MPILLCDIDGTLANIKHRIFRKPGVDFYANIAGDTPIPAIINLVKQYRLVGYQVMLLTGRPERVRTQTEQWLNRNGVQYSELIMKDNVDERKPANEWKQEQILK